MTVRVPASQPLVSVIIPTYNYGHFVMAAIESVQRQDYSQIEVIVIDDGSTDNTPQLLSCRTDLIYVRQENQGLSAARNHGIRLAKGKYLQFLDADDLLGVTSIRERVEFLENNPDKSAVICRSAFFREQPRPDLCTFKLAEWRQPDKGFIDLALYYFNIAPPHAFLVRKSIVDNHALWFDTNLRACEDYDFWFRLAQLSGIPGAIRTCWVYYRQHEQSMSRSYANQYRHDAELCRRIFAATSGGTLWLGNLPPTDYFAAMFAAGLLTARRLWFVDRLSFTDFSSSYLLPLQEKLKEAQHQIPSTAAAQFHYAHARLTLNRMFLRDASIDFATYQVLSRALPKRPSLFVHALKLGMAPVSLRTLARLLKLDLQYALLALSARRRDRASKGQHRPSQTEGM